MYERYIVNGYELGCLHGTDVTLDGREQKIKDVLRSTKRLTPNYLFEHAASAYDLRSSGSTLAVHPEGEERRVLAELDDEDCLAHRGDTTMVVRILAPGLEPGVDALIEEGTLTTLFVKTIILARAIFDSRRSVHINAGAAKASSS